MRMLRLSRNPSLYEGPSSGQKGTSEGTSTLHLIGSESELVLEFYSYMGTVLVLTRHNEEVLSQDLLNPAKKSMCFKMGGHTCTISLIAMYLPKSIDIGIEAPRSIRAVRGEIRDGIGVNSPTGAPSFEVLRTVL